MQTGGVSWQCFRTANGVLRAISGVVQSSADAHGAKVAEVPLPEFGSSWLPVLSSECLRETADGLWLDLKVDVLRRVGHLDPSRIQCLLQRRIHPVFVVGQSGSPLLVGGRLHGIVTGIQGRLGRWAELGDLKTFIAAAPE